MVKIDYWGAALLSVGIALLLLWVTFAGDKFAWASWQTFAMLGASAVTLAAALWVESRVDEPIIPLGLFRNRTLVLSVVASVAVGIAMFGTSVFLSQYMQLARGKTPTESGLMTIPMIAGVLLSSTISGAIISRTGKYKAFMIWGAVLLTGGIGLMATIHYDTSFVLVSAYMVILGAGVGMLMQNLVLAVQNTLHVSEIGSGTATVAFFRTLGGAIGVSALGAVLSNKSTEYIVRGLATLGIDPAGVGGDGALPDVATLPAPVRTVVEQSFGDAIADLFLVATPIALIALVAVLFLKEVPLGRRSGVEQRLEEELAESAAAIVPVTDELVPAALGTHDESARPDEATGSAARRPVETQRSHR